ncbi:MAG: hypothetical protein OXE92_05840 [Bacteroidetes bacterium]|nr:hypothetical protein [Bacteroidota bacterium]MCY4205229.1 hypothetical protein [Bacteroidota bacterium]
MKDKIIRLTAGICLIAMFGTVAYIGGLATHSVFAPSDVIAAEEEARCENNVCIKNWRGKKKCKIPVGILNQDVNCLKKGGVRVIVVDDNG